MGSRCDTASIRLKEEVSKVVYEILIARLLKSAPNFSRREAANAILEVVKVVEV